MATFAAISFDEANTLVMGEGFAGLAARAAVPDLVDIIDGWRPDVLVRETFEFAGCLAAELRGVDVGGQGPERQRVGPVANGHQQPDRPSRTGRAGRRPGAGRRDGLPRRVRLDARRAGARAPARRRAAVSGDQWHNARRVHAIGAGIALTGAPRGALELPGPDVLDALPGAVRRVLEQPGFRRAAGEIARDMAALPPLHAAPGVLKAIAFAVARAA